MAYLDHAATTPLRPEAAAAMAAEFARVGNASSLHASGRRARRIVEEAREAIAAHLCVRPSDIVFTAGGTESDNLAVKGLYASRRAADPARRIIVTTGIEHHALLDPLEFLEKNSGAEVVHVPVDRNGRVDVEAFTRIVEREQAAVSLISVMWANNEVGTVQPIAELSAVARDRGIPFHSDAVQVIGHLEVDLSAVAVDAMSVSGHKFGGPTGVGLLVLARELEPVPLLHGGGQERDVRSGTLDVAGIAGFAAALDAAIADRDARIERTRDLQRRLIAGIQASVPDAVLNGDPELDDVHRLPGNVHFSFPGCEGDALLLLLDAQGVECSTGSACSAGIAQPSHVLVAMGADEVVARSSLRFSLGHTSTPDDVEQAVAAIGPAVERARLAGSVAARGA